MNDIAARVGVSQTTVSFVLNGRTNGVNISADTRQRVMNAAREMGYRPNQLARAMVTGKSRILGVLTSGGTSEYGTRILTGIIEAASERGYLLKVLQLSYSELDDSVIARCAEWRLTGATLVGLSDEVQEYLHGEFRRARISMAMIEAGHRPDWGVRIASDDAQGLRLAVSHLAGLGHTKIAFLGGRPGKLSATRTASFYAAMEAVGLESRDSWVINSSWSKQNDIEPVARELLAEGREIPTAVVCSGDMIAMVLTRVARARGLRLPADLSVTGFSDAALSAFADPPLTTVAQSFQDMGREAVRYLAECAENGEPDGSSGGDAKREILLPTRLIERASTAPPRTMALT